MCCRYYFGQETAEYIQAQNAWSETAVSLRCGDIRPSDQATVLTGKNLNLCLENMRWGFPSFVSGKLLINARSETAWEKHSFADSMEKRRCIVPAQHFYEWDNQKNMVTFTVPDTKIIWMAGIYSNFEDGMRFTILTTQANDSMLPVHDRMPVILREEILRDWIFDSNAARKILSEEQPQLSRWQEYEQLSLF